MSRCMRTFADIRMARPRYIVPTYTICPKLQIIPMTWQPLTGGFPEVNSSLLKAGRFSKMHIMAVSSDRILNRNRAVSIDVTTYLRIR